MLNDVNAGDTVLFNLLLLQELDNFSSVEI